MAQLLSILQTIFIMGIVLGFMILIHEFGHFAVAKYFGVRVEVFSIGFGKRLLGFTRGETDYRISAIPLGGYVKMSGENPMDDRTGDPGEFLSHPRWQRFLIALAGPVMNIMLAVALLTSVYMVHYEYPAVLDEPTVVGWVNPDTPAEKAGIQSGDKIVRVENIENPNWEQVDAKVMLSPNQPLKFGIERDGKVMEKVLVPEPLGSYQYGDIGWVPKESTLLTLVEPGMPADRAGIKIGDQILSANGQDIPHLGALIKMLNHTKDQPLQLVVLRDGQKLAFTVKPALDPNASAQDNRYRIGVASIPTKVIRLNFPDALKRSLSYNKKNSFLILELLQKMVQHKVSMRQVDGPIGIGRDVGQAAREKGWTPLLEISAAISLNLGIMNLLPIPILDGGHVLMLLIEGSLRRDLSIAVKERFVQVGLVFLLGIFAFVMYSDIFKLIQFH